MGDEPPVQRDDPTSTESDEEAGRMRLPTEEEDRQKQLQRGKLTRRALFYHTVDEMRKRGESEEEVPKIPPTEWGSSEDSAELHARVMRSLAERGCRATEPEEGARRDREDEALEKRREAKKREYEGEGGESQDTVSREASILRMVERLGTRVTDPEERARMDRQEEELENRMAAKRAEYLENQVETFVTYPYNRALDTSSYQYMNYDPASENRLQDSKETADEKVSRRGEGSEIVSGSQIIRDPIRRLYFVPPRRNYSREVVARSESNFDADWNHQNEFQQLQDKFRMAANPDLRSTRLLFETLDMGAFADESDRPNATDGEHDDGPAAAAPGVPKDFPPHCTINGLAELGAYLAASQYIVSLGGAPLPDLKYGIIVVPVGDEDLLFRGYGDHAAISPAFKDDIYAKSKAAQKVERMELRELMEQERWMGEDWKAELDEEDVNFYRKRWRERRGLDVDEDEPNRQSGSQEAEADVDVDAHRQASPTPSKRKDASSSSQPSKRVSREPVSMNAEQRGSEMSRRTTEHPTTEEPPIEDREEVAGEGCAVATIPSDQDVPSIERRKSLERPSSNAGSEVSTRDTKQASTKDLVQGGIPTTVSNEARGVLEAFLRATSTGSGNIFGGGAERQLDVKKGRRRSSSRRVLHSLLPHRKTRHDAAAVVVEDPPPPPSLPANPEARRSVLLEVAGIVTGMANGDLLKNPGVDQGIWEAAQRDLTGG